MPFFFNLFNSIDGRIEANAHVRSKWSEKLQNTLFIHYNDRKRANDKNRGQFGIELLPENFMYRSRNSSSEGIPSCFRFKSSNPYR